MIDKKYIVVEGKDVDKTMDILYSHGFEWKGESSRLDDNVLRYGLSNKKTVAFVLDKNLISWQACSIQLCFTEDEKEELEDRGFQEITLNHLSREKKLKRIIEK